MLADAAKILFALGLPFLTGAFFVTALGRTCRPGHCALIAGLGLPLGLVGIIGGYLVLDKWGPGLHFGTNLAFQVALLVVLAYLGWWRWRRPLLVPKELTARDRWADLSAGTHWLLGLLVAWLLLRWLGIVIEVIYRPLFPWDAWRGFATEAKIWFFNPNAETSFKDLAFFKEGSAYTAGTKHPSGVALIQLWSLQVIGHYNDAWMNLAWPTAMASIGLILFGTMRMVGASLLTGVVVAASVLTLPMLNTQAVLAGYGDIWIGLFLLVATVSGLLAKVIGLKWFVPMLVAVAGMLMIKQTSLLWVSVLVFGIMAGWIHLRWLVVLFLAGLTGFFIFLWLYGEPIRVTGLGRLGFSSDGFILPNRISLDAWREIVIGPDLLRHMFVYRNWHLFWCLAPIVALASVWCARSKKVFAMIGMVAWGGLALLICFFSFSSLGEVVIDGTSVNRLLLHLVPTIALLGGLVVLDLLGRLDSEPRS